MPSHVSIYSDCDIRGCTLFPPVPDESGALGCMVVDDVACMSLEPDCTDPRGHGFTLRGVAGQFLRLGSKSRMQVMALYRAIIERYEIMRASGECGRRPARFEFCGNGRFGGLTAACDREEIAANPRRVFGGTFRDSFRGVVSELVSADGPVEYCGVTRYPPTPAKRGTVPDADTPTFTQCASRASFNWSAMSCGYQGADLFGAIARDLTQRTAAPRFGDAMAGVARRPLLRAIAHAYACTCLPCAAQVCYRAGCAIDDQLPADLEPTGGLGEVFGRCGCVPLPYPCDNYGICAGPRFNLFALALAMRILSVVNVQTVRRPANVAIPHVRITARRMLGFDVVGDCVQVSDEALSWTCSIVCADVAEARIRTSYITGAGHVSRRVWYNSCDRVECGGAGWVCDCIMPSCWHCWTARPSCASCAVDAVAELFAVWPCVRHVAQGHAGGYVAFGGARYPARWAQAEGDVGFAAMTTLARSLYRRDGSCVTRGAVLRSVNSCRSCLMRIAADDVMDWLAGLGIDAALWRVACDIQADIVSCADMPGKSLRFPVSSSAAFGDLGCTPNAAGIRPSSNGEWNHGAIHICWVDGQRVPKYYENGQWLAVSVVCDAQGQWWLLEGKEQHASWRYDRGCYHAWASGHESVRFGGFFGTFGFRNTADLQVC